MNPPHQHSRTGLTLLELLLVVFILSTIALSAVSLVDRVDEQSRFEETKRHWQEIRKAIVGDPNKTINGETAISGFVADVGRLPFSIQELIEQGNLPTWQLDNESGIWSGWRGPYLNAKPESLTGRRAFRDGWGSRDDLSIFPLDPNYGWKEFIVGDPSSNNNLLPNGIAIEEGAVLLQSFGSDSEKGSTDFPLGDGLASSDNTYEQDYPFFNQVSNVGLQGVLLVQQKDHLMNLKGWSITVQFTNNTGNQITVDPSQYRIQIYYPKNGNLSWLDGSWPNSSSERDTVAHLSQKSTNAAQAVEAGETLEAIFTFDNTVDHNIPWGIRSMAVVADGDGTVFAVNRNVSNVIHLIPRQQLPVFSDASPLVWQLE